MKRRTAKKRQRRLEALSGRCFKRLMGDHRRWEWAIYIRDAESIPVYLFMQWWFLEGRKLEPVDE